MKDRLQLILAGLICALGAWALFQFLGNDVWSTLQLLSLIAVIAENRRLRAKLREVTASSD